MMTDVAAEPKPDVFPALETPVFSLQNGQLVLEAFRNPLQQGLKFTTSMAVAEYFDKHHKNVLRDIRALIKITGDWAQLNFEPCKKINQLANNKTEPYYEMSREGFILLTSGYTGKHALRNILAAAHQAGLAKQSSPTEGECHE